MKWVLCLVAAAAFAQGDLMSVLSGGDAKKEVQKAEVAKAAAAAEGQRTGSETQVFMINPAERAKDYKDTFDFLRSQKSASKVSFLLTNGKSIGNIAEITLPTSGSLLIFRLNTTQGTKFQVVKVEDIASIEQM